MEMGCVNGPAVRPSLEIFRHFSSEWREFHVSKAKMVSVHRGTESADLRHTFDMHGGGVNITSV